MWKADLATERDLEQLRRMMTAPERIGILPRIFASLLVIVVGTAVFNLGLMPRYIGTLMISASPLVFRFSVSLNGSSGGLLDLPRQPMSKLKDSWPLGLSIALSVIESFYLLHLDAVEGHDQVFPVLYFTGAVLMGMAYYIYVRITP